MASSKLEKIPETLLKKRKRLDEIQARSVAGQILAKKPRRHAVQRITFKRAEKFIKEYRVKERYEKDLKRKAKRPSSCKPSLPSEPHVVFVVRLLSPNPAHDEPKKILNMLRLTKVNHGVFLQMNKTTLDLLQLVEPFVTWGRPSVETVRDLLYKRGKVRVGGGKQVALNDNALVERALGSCGIVCLEDLIHEIVTLGVNFKNVISLLWDFKLNAPVGGWKKTAASFSNGGDCGDRGEAINSLLHRMI